MNYTLVLLTVCVAAYFLGSIPTGYLAGRLLKNIDLREHGSKSVGATNAFRTLGAYPAIAVLLVDVLKGVLAVSLATWICAISKANFNVPTTQSETWIVAVAGIVVLVGHARPIWLRFRGGKSVAASLGVMIAISPTVASAALLVFFGRTCSNTDRVSGLDCRRRCCSSIGVYFSAAGSILAFDNSGRLYVIFRHRANISRILSGSEPRLGRN